MNIQGISGYSDGRNSMPSFGRITKLNGELIDNYKRIHSQDVKDLVDTFKKSKPIKNFCKNHDVEVAFTETPAKQGTAMGFSFTDPSVNPKRSSNVIFSNGVIVEPNYISKGIRYLKKKVEKITSDDLEKGLKQVRTDSKEAEKEFAKTQNIAERTNLSKKQEQYINDSLNEIKNW